MSSLGTIDLLTEITVAFVHFYVELDINDTYMLMAPSRPVQTV
jgi:hypothetical protein